VSFASIDTKIAEPRYRRAWRNDDGTIHATVALGESTLYFDSADDARAVAAACTEAAGALDRLAAEASPPSAGGGE
jgi:hypothetical protein